MDSIPDRLLEELAEKWLNGTLTREEEAIFNQWYEAQSEEEIPVEGESRVAFRDMMLAQIKHVRQDKDVKFMPEHSGKTALRRWLLPLSAVAAMLIIIFGLFWYARQPGTSSGKGQIVVQDVKPGGNKAVLTLANGQTIILDTAQNGQLASQGNMTVTKADSGLLVYQTESTKQRAENSVSYNTLTTPKGGKFQVVLPDGTKVWLNTASSIRYPVAFTGGERKVEITGEAYFEVVHNAKMPFKVQAGTLLIEDIGTHFDVNSYGDEPDSKVTLLEGSVKVSLSSSQPGRILKPGQQAHIDNSGIMRIISNANMNGAVAWKNGLFDFSGSDLKGIMRQMERWYNISVVYAPGLPDYQFGGQTYMNTNLSEVLKVLELNGIHFKLEKGGPNDPARLIIEP